MQITSNFDSGNIHVVQSLSPSNIQLEIKKDNQSEFFQWFHFKLHNTNRCEHVLHITNASEAAFSEGWEDYQAVASYDCQEWFRVPTTYDGKQLTIKFTQNLTLCILPIFALIAMSVIKTLFIQLNLILIAN